MKTLHPFLWASLWVLALLSRDTHRQSLLLMTDLHKKSSQIRQFMGKHFDKHEVHTHKKYLGRREAGVDFDSHVGIWEFTLFIPPGNLLWGFNFIPVLRPENQEPWCRCSFFWQCGEKYSQSQGRTQSPESCDDCREQRRGSCYLLLAGKERGER